MNLSNFLYAQNEVTVAVGIFLALLAATEAGFRRGSRQRIAREEGPGQVSNLQTATIGLLALLLAFTFAMAESRFEIRRTLVVDESNAIGTAYLRSQMLPEPLKTQLAASLRNYVDARLDYARAGIDEISIGEANQKSDLLQKQLWSEALQAVDRNPAPVPTGLFVSALNEVFDVRSRRDAARQNHVPEVVLWLLFFVAVGTMELVGYGCGLGGPRNFVRTATISGLISLVILVIVDLDRPRRGIIEVSQVSMRMLRDSIK